MLALKTGRTLTAVIEDALKEALARHKAYKSKKPVKLKTFKGTGLKPGVDLDNSAELLEIMERPS